MDVKKIGRIPDGGGWRAMAAEPARLRDRNTKVGFDYIHSLVDDHSRLAYSEILSDEKGPTCAAFLERAIGYFADHGITRIERLMTDNAWAYRHSLRAVCARHRIGQEIHQTAPPWQNAKVRAPQPDRADRVGLPTGVHHQRRARCRPCAMARALQHSTTPHRPQGPPTHQPTVTYVMSGYI
jgi:hypothetical protein